MYSWYYQYVMPTALPPQYAYFVTKSLLVLEGIDDLVDKRFKLANSFANDRELLIGIEYC